MIILFTPLPYQHGKKHVAVRSLVDTSNAGSLGVEVFRRGKQVRVGRPDDLTKTEVEGEMVPFWLTERKKVSVTMHIRLCADNNRTVNQRWRGPLTTTCILPGRQHAP